MQYSSTGSTGSIEVQSVQPEHAASDTFTLCHRKAVRQQVTPSFNTQACLELRMLPNFAGFPAKLQKYTQ
jgi:hypothetical protein